MNFGPTVGSARAEPNVWTDDSATTATWITWALFFLAACVVLFWTETGLPVNHAYTCGSQRWLAGQNLYHGGCGFIYLPQAAVLYAPFHVLPDAAEHVLWRFVTIGLFALGICRLSRLAGPDSPGLYFLLITVLVLPKAWTCAYSGQATPAMAGLLMMALPELHHRNWNRATLFLLTALAVKPLAIVLLLLVWAIYPALHRRMALGLVLFAAAPYLTQNWHYVSSQYVAALSMFDDAMQIGLASNWAQLVTLGGLAGIEISEKWQMVLRIATAAETLALCWQIRQHTHAEFKIDCRHHEDGTDRKSTGAGSFRTFELCLPAASRPATDLILIYALSVCYLLLMNPRTENNSYVMLSPVLAVMCVRAAFLERRKLRAGLMWGGVVALVAGHEVCGLLTPHAGSIWICPLVCLLLTLDCVRAALRTPGRPAIVSSHSIEQPVLLPFPQTAPAPVLALADAA